ncbi:hypothetical protein BJX99DRAFT_259013 [Aspergillus californicus]
MPREYTKIWQLCPRSFLFAIVADVGGTSRSLAVAYRQGDNYIKESYFERVDHFVADTLALIEILSDPANRALLEAERALAEDYQFDCSERPSVPDSVQPPWVSWYERNKGPQYQPQLPWRGDALTEFPFITTCLLLGLLGDNGDGEKKDKASKRSRTRPSDVQLQPLSTLFRGDCLEYGLVILDISDLDSGVKYGIAAFPVCYMAEVGWLDRSSGWNEIGNPLPEKEPDIIPFNPRPRVLLSISQWLSKYYCYNHLRNKPSFLYLDGMPLVSPAALDYIWPRDLDLYQLEAKTFWPTVLDDPPKNLWMDREKDGSTTRASSVTISGEPPQNIPEDIDSAINGLLVLTQVPEPPLEQTAIDLQMFVKFPEKLRQQLEEVPDRLGPSKISSYVLRVAYTGCSYLNWVVFQNLPPSVIAAAVASDELQGVSALSLCVDQLKLLGDNDEERGLPGFAAALAQSAGLKQLCLLQRPDRDSDDASARLCAQLLLLWERRELEGGGGGGGLEWLYEKALYPTYAFSTSLRSREFRTSSSTISHSSTSPHTQVFPMVHMFRFVDHQGDDSPGKPTHHVRQYQNYYAMGNTLLDAESFALRFLAYLRSLGSGSDFEKAILRFAHKGFSSSSSPGHSSVRPIPAGFFDYEIPPNDPSRVRLGDIQPGSWVVLVDSSAKMAVETQYWDELPPGTELPLPDWAIAYLAATDPSDPDPTQPSASTSSSLSDDDTVVADNGAFLYYTFIEVRHPSADIDIAHENHQQRPFLPIGNPPAVVAGGLTSFLRATAPGTDIATWDGQIEEVERDIRICTGRASIGTGNDSIDIGVMPERRARALLNQLL